MSDNNDELMSYEESRKYLISEGLDPDQIAKEGMVFIKTVKENIELKKQLKEKDEQLTKLNEMIDRLAEALDIFNRADANSGLQTSILKHNELIFIRKALTEYQNSKK